ncbi:MAG: hypothetical protein MI794_10630 [Pseudomonadales bacterium]|nr:hypothetical protein [Pseudomonadales bacterium]
MEWVIDNKEWIFSGFAVAVPLAFLGWFFSVKRNKQVQKGGDGSTNIQVGNNLNVRKDDE